MQTLNTACPPRPPDTLIPLTLLPGPGAGRPRAGASVQWFCAQRQLRGGPFFPGPHSGTERLVSLATWENHSLNSKSHRVPAGGAPGFVSRALRTWDWSLARSHDRGSRTRKKSALLPFSGHQAPAHSQASARTRQGRALLLFPGSQVKPGLRWEWGPLLAPSQSSSAPSGLPAPTLEPAGCLRRPDPAGPGQSQARTFSPEALPPGSCQLHEADTWGVDGLSPLLPCSPHTPSRVAALTVRVGWPHPEVLC